MKTFMKIVLFGIYFMSLPILAIFMVGVLTVTCLHNLRDFGELDLKDSAEALLAGMIEGHRINMKMINDYDDLELGD